MPNRGSALTSGSPETPDCSDRVTPEAPDEPDQLKRGFFERLFDRMGDIAISEAEHGPADARRYFYSPTYMLRGLEELHLEFTPRA